MCAADIARRNGDAASAARYEKTADDWQKKVEGWTATVNGPYSPRPYYLRLTKDGRPNSGTAYNIGDSGPTVDQRKVVDPSYLELVRLGVKPANDPVVLNTVSVVDQQLASGDASGRFFWHRFNFDGYGEQKDGSPWDFGFPQNMTEVWANNTTIGRNWPIFGGERGEYECSGATPPERAPGLPTWRPPATTATCCPSRCGRRTSSPPGEPGFPVGEGTFSATPLAWSHAQFVRLAWSIDAGEPGRAPGDSRGALRRLAGGDRAQEGPQLAVEALRRVDVADVTGSGDEHEPRARDPRVEVMRDVSGRAQVPVAVQEQGRHVHAGQDIAKVGLGERARIRPHARRMELAHARREFLDQLGRRRVREHGRHQLVHQLVGR